MERHTKNTDIFNLVLSDRGRRYLRQVLHESRIVHPYDDIRLFMYNSDTLRRTTIIRIQEIERHLVEIERRIKSFSPLFHMQVPCLSLTSSALFRAVIPISCDLSQIRLSWNPVLANTQGVITITIYRSDDKKNHTFLFFSYHITVENRFSDILLTRVEALNGEIPFRIGADGFAEVSEIQTTPSQI